MGLALKSTTALVMAPETPTPRLTFCIPTLNFAAFLPATLESIIAQADERVDIVIVDGGSTDDTAEVVRQIASHFPRITFVQRAMRVGVDRDILEAVALATGDFCWLFSSDDLLTPGAVAEAFAEIRSGTWDILLTGVLLCDRDMKPLGRHGYFRCNETRTFDWSMPDHRQDYLQRSRTTTAFCSFISSVVVNRRRWLAAEGIDPFIGSCWIIAAKMFAMDRDGLVVRHNPALLVHKRGDNDSFMSEGVNRRLSLSLRGFRDLARHFYGPRAAEFAHVTRVIANEYSLRGLLHAKRLVAATHSKAEMAAFYDLAAYRYDSGTLWARACLLTLRLAPVWLVACLQHGFAGMRWLRSRLAGK
jgi:abequosyltransferase